MTHTEWRMVFLVVSVLAKIKIRSYKTSLHFRQGKRGGAWGGSIITSEGLGLAAARGLK